MFPMKLEAYQGIAKILIEDVTLETKQEALTHAKLVNQWAESLPDKKPRVRKARTKKNQASPSPAARLKKRKASSADAAPATPSDD